MQPSFGHSKDCFTHLHYANQSVPRLSWCGSRLRPSGDFQPYKKYFENVIEAEKAKLAKSQGELEITRERLSKMRELLNDD